MAEDLIWNKKSKPGPEKQPRLTQDGYMKIVDDLNWPKKVRGVLESVYDAWTGQPVKKK